MWGKELVNYRSYCLRFKESFLGIRFIGGYFLYIV